MITKVTFTGADDSVAPAQLIELSHKFPFIEWGILVSDHYYGLHRFPSGTWLETLAILYDEADPKPNLSLHVCGQYVRDFLTGTGSVFDAIDSIGVWQIFNRVQLNTHALPHRLEPSFLDLLAAHKEKQFIIQVDGVNNDGILYLARHQGFIRENQAPGISALFDLSHGAGILPAQWPRPIPHLPCGYAGGLGPENLAEQWDLIEAAAGDTEIWIDMETRVRSHHDLQFDLGKVRFCCEIARSKMSVTKS